jgi:hypothetical protein
MDKKLLVITAGTVAAGVGQEFLRQVNARSNNKKPLYTVVRSIDTTHVPSTYSNLLGGEWYGVSADPQHIDAIEGSMATRYPGLARLLYPGTLPETTMAGGIRYNSAGSVLINKEKLNEWFKQAFMDLASQGQRERNIAVAIVSSAVGATGSGSLEHLVDIVVRAAQEVGIPTPLQCDIFILQPGTINATELGEANTVALYAEMAASQLQNEAINASRRSYQGRTIMMGWGDGYSLSSLEQLQEVTASVIRIINDPISNISAEYYQRLVDNHVPHDVEPETGLPSHLSTATMVTINLGDLEKQFFKRDVYRLQRFAEVLTSPTRSGSITFFSGEGSIFPTTAVLDTLHVGHDERLGSCTAIVNCDTSLYCTAYGGVGEASIPPIEDRPFYHYQPESHIVCWGGLGCNLRCAFCQNWEVAFRNRQRGGDLTGPNLSRKATIALTYGETLWLACSPSRNGPCEVWWAFFAAFSGDLYYYGQNYHTLHRRLSNPQIGDIITSGTDPQDISTTIHKYLHQQFYLHISASRKMDVIQLWSFSLTKVGQIWDDEIQSYLRATHIVLLQISPRFLVSEESTFLVEATLKDPLRHRVGWHRIEWHGVEWQCVNKWKDGREHLHAHGKMENVLQAYDRLLHLDPSNLVSFTSTEHNKTLLVFLDTSDVVEDYPIVAVLRIDLVNLLNWVILFMAHIYHHLNMSVLEWILQRVSLSGPVQSIGRNELVKLLLLPSFVPCLKEDGATDSAIRKSNHLVLPTVMSTDDQQQEPLKQKGKVALSRRTLLVETGVVASVGVGGGVLGDRLATVLLSSTPKNVVPFLLLHHLQAHRCLLVLDNFESLLEADQSVGQYREGYGRYGLLHQFLGEAGHQSGLLLTGRQQLREVVEKMEPLPVRSFEMRQPRTRTQEDLE